MTSANITGFLTPSPLSGHFPLSSYLYTISVGVSGEPFLYPTYADAIYAWFLKICDVDALNLMVILMTLRITWPLILRPPVFLFVKIFSKVDFPAPLEPIIANNEPGSAKPVTESRSDAVLTLPLLQI